MSSSIPYVPERGDVCWIDLDPIIGHEQAGPRPAVVLSQRVHNSTTGMAIVCPVTNQAKGYFHEVPLPTGLSITGVVLCDHVRAVDRQARGVRFAAVVPSGVMTTILSKLLRAVS